MRFFGRAKKSRARLPRAPLSALNPRQGVASLALRWERLMEQVARRLPNLDHRC